MNEIYWQELALAVLALIGWCVIIIKLLDTWSNKQQQEHRIDRTEIQSINRELITQVQKNTAAIEKMHRLLDLRLFDIEVKLECQMDSSRQISSIDFRTIEIARTLGKINSIASQLGSNEK